MEMLAGSRLLDGESSAGAEGRKMPREYENGQEATLENCRKRWTRLAVAPEERKILSKQSSSQTRIV